MTDTIRVEISGRTVTADFANAAAIHTAPQATIPDRLGGVSAPSLVHSLGAASSPPTETV